MKFTCTIDINVNIDKVVEIFSNPDNLKHTQDGFVSKTLVSGIEGQEGATSKMVYKKLELMETILTNNLPEEFIGLYVHKHTTNTMKVNFKELETHKTRYSSEIEYTKLNGMMIKIIATLFPSMFKKQVEKWMMKFKNFAEKE